MDDYDDYDNYQFENTHLIFLLVLINVLTIIISLLICYKCGIFKLNKNKTIKYIPAKQYINSEQENEPINI